MEDKQRVKENEREKEKWQTVEKTKEIMTILRKENEEFYLRRRKLRKEEVTIDKLKLNLH